MKYKPTKDLCAHSGDFAICPHVQSIKCIEYEIMLWRSNIWVWNKDKDDKAKMEPFEWSQEKPEKAYSNVPYNLHIYTSFEGDQSKVKRVNK